ETKRKNAADADHARREKEARESEKDFQRLIRLQDELASFSQDNGPERTREVRKIAAKQKTETELNANLKGLLSDTENSPDDGSGQKSFDLARIKNELQ